MSADVAASDFADHSPFTQWAHDPARTIDERYLVWLLCHAAQRAWWMNQDLTWRRENRCPAIIDHQTHQRYRLNPALVPTYSEGETQFAARHAHFLTTFEQPGTSSGARPIRNAEALRFFPALETVKLGNTGLSDLSWVEELPRLRCLQVSSGELEDFTPLACAPRLRNLILHLCSELPETPAPPLLWPDVRALSALEELEVLCFYPNAAALQGLHFPRLREARLICQGQRDAHCLPEMPALSVLVCEGMESLRGINRYPELRNLTVGGSLRDFGDLPALRHLTSLTLNTQAGWPRDLGPVATLPELRVANFGGEHPRNFWPLAAAPKLRRLEAHSATGVALDVQAINAALLPWDHDFLAPEPRPLPPLRFVADEPVLAAKPGDDIPDPDLLADPEIFFREMEWMADRCRRAVSDLLGHDDGLCREGTSGASRTALRRTVSFSVQTQDLAERLPEFIDLLRRSMAESPRDWVFKISVFLRVPNHLFDEQRKQWLKQIESRYGRWREESPEERDLEIERYRQTRQHLMDSAHRLRTATEDGETPEPEDFTPPEVVGPTGRGTPRPVTATPNDRTGDARPADDDFETDDDIPDDFRLRSFDEQERERQRDGDDHRRGGEDGPAVKSDPDPPDWFVEDPNAHPLAGSYSLYGQLTWDTFRVDKIILPTAESLMRRKAEEIDEDLEAREGNGEGGERG